MSNKLNNKLKKKVNSQPKKKKVNNKLIFSNLMMINLLIMLRTRKIKKVKRPRQNLVQLVHKK